LKAIDDPEEGTVLNVSLMYEKRFQVSKAITYLMNFRSNFKLLESRLKSFESKEEETNSSLDFMTLPFILKQLKKKQDKERKVDIDE
jgi:hypothetical protein